MNVFVAMKRRMKVCGGRDSFEFVYGPIVDQYCWVVPVEEIIGGRKR